ncbi:NAD-dependent epimerase/dehydratase family protein [Cognatiyoonia sp.]|uniref:NAD-dependent epimerase/dehydratase family protein n=1 Tax=Cognatiyoonia sp. TaxID=2211652 RepID=UPI003F6992C2
MSKTRTVLVTGSAGFIGFWLSRLLLERGFKVVGLDSLSSYYDVGLKEARLAQLTGQRGFTQYHAKVEDADAVRRVFEDHQPDVVVHLAGQAGVRHSLKSPRDYVDANLVGSFNIMEGAREFGVEHLLMASTSSVYGANREMPYRETDKVDTQMSFYAATKKANEAMAHSYAHLHNIPTTMFRFFTVYGPWGRPDMAPYLFTSAILVGEPIKVFNHGNMQRDFTYVADLVEGIRLLLDVPPTSKGKDGDSLSPVAPYRIVNIGNSEPVKLLDFIEAIETATGKLAEKVFMDIQPGDVPVTWADASLLQRLTGYRPATDIQTGVAAYVDWFKSYYPSVEEARPK